MISFLKPLDEALLIAHEYNVIVMLGYCIKTITVLD